MAPVTAQRPRPSHTTMAAFMVIGGSVLVVITVAEQLSGLYSLETREAIATFLSQPPGSGLGLDVGGARSLLRVALMVVAGCAAAAAILGFHVLRRSHRARLGLTVLAVPLFLGGLATGGFLTSVVAAASMLLWIGPSGAWFRDEPPAQEKRPWPHEQPRQEQPEPPPPADTPQHPFPPGPGPASSGPATRPDLPPAQPWRRRPDSVVWACVLTWASCGLVLTVLGASLTLLLADSGLVLDELRRQNPELAAQAGLDRDELIRSTYLLMGVVAVWSLTAIALAVGVYRGSRGARTALVVSSAVAAVLCLLASVTSALMVVPVLSCVATVVLLSRPEARAWVAAPRRDP